VFLAAEGEGEGPTSGKGAIGAQGLEKENLFHPNKDTVIFRKRMERPKGEGYEGKKKKKKKKNPQTKKTKKNC